MRVWIALGWAPAAMASATLVCLRSWTRHCTPAFASARRKWLFQKLELTSGLPAAFGNTSPSTPASAYASRCEVNRFAVNCEIVIERIDAGVFGSLRSHSPLSSRTSCEVTRTLRAATSRSPRLRPTNSLQRMPVSTAK